MGITPYTIQYTRIAYLFHNSSLLILYSWFVPPHFPLPFGNHKFVFVSVSLKHTALWRAITETMVHYSSHYPLQSSQDADLYAFLFLLWLLGSSDLNLHCLECTYKTFMAWISVFKFILLINLNFPFVLFSSFKKKKYIVLCMLFFN